MKSHTTLKQNLAAIHQHSKNPLLSSEIKIVAASKAQPDSKIREAFSLGLRDFGENYVQELLTKNRELADISSQIRWHFIGHLQQNKAKKIVSLVQLIQSVDSVALAQKIDSVSSEHQKTSDILIEINVGSEKTKFGIDPQELQSFISELTDFSNIQIRGLMCMPPLLEPQQVAPYFEKTRQLFDSLSEIKQDNLKPAILSMGTSADFETAIANGSTMVRIGTRLFGERQPKKK